MQSDTTVKEKGYKDDR